MNKLDRLEKAYAGIHYHGILKATAQYPLNSSSHPQHHILSIPEPHVPRIAVEGGHMRLCCLSRCFLDDAYVDTVIAAIKHRS